MATIRELAQYIRDERQKGRTLEEIGNELRDIGYDLQKVADTFTYAGCHVEIKRFKILFFPEIVMLKVKDLSLTDKSIWAAEAVVKSQGDDTATQAVEAARAMRDQHDTFANISWTRGVK